MFLYGSSLGGYCAIYYAGAVNGTVLAASPRNSAHPLLQNKEGAHSFNHSYHIKENELTSNNIYILSDPSNKLDVLFLEKIILVSYPNVYVYKFPHVGHANLLRHLQEHDKLGDLIRYAVNNKVDAINRLFQQPIKSSFYLLGNAKHHSVKLNEYLSLLSKMEDKMGVENTERYKKLKNDVYINKELVNKQYALIKKQEQTINKLLYKEKRLKESTSWKVTKPLRIAGGVYRRLIRYLANVMRQIGARVAR